MRITVVDLPADSGGALSILLDFCRFAAASGGGAHQWTFVVGAADLPTAAHVAVQHYPQAKRSWPARLWFETFRLPGIVRATQPDVVLSLQNLSVRGVGVPQVVYVHQALPFLTDVRRYSFFRPGERLYAFYQHIYGRWIERGVRQSAACVVQTHCTAKKVAEQSGVALSKVRVIPPTIDVPQGTQPPWPDGAPVNTRRFVYPAAFYPYKNHACLVAAVRLLRQRGIKDFEVILTLAPRLRAALGAEDLPQLVFADQIARATLLALLAESVLVLPTYIESYPMPLAEARRLGGVAIVAETPFGRELSAGYPNACFFDAHAPEQLADQMQRVLAGEVMYHAVSQAQAETASSWAQVLTLLEEVASKNT